MLGPDSDASTLITSIQKHIDKHVRKGAILAGKLGGDDAVEGFLRATLLNLGAIAMKERGREGAEALMVEGLLTIEGLDEEEP